MQTVHIVNFFCNNLNLEFLIWIDIWASFPLYTVLNRKICQESELSPLATWYKWGLIHFQVFKEDIEKTDQPGGPILDPQESKTIFGGIPPIYEAHNKICAELNETVSSSNWIVGRIFLRHVIITCCTI